MSIGEVYVHPHALKHGLTEEEMLRAWSNYVRSQNRSAPNEDQNVRVGFGFPDHGAIQMVGIAKEFGVLVIHALTPPQDNVLKELGLSR